MSDPQPLPTSAADVAKAKDGLWTVEKRCERVAAEQYVGMFDVEYELV